jgi:hypothetical protein
VAISKNIGPYLKNKQSKNGWRHGFSGRVLASQCETPSSKLSIIKKCFIFYINTNIYANLEVSIYTEEMFLPMWHDELEPVYSSCPSSH